MRNRPFAVGLLVLLGLTTLPAAAAQGARSSDADAPDPIVPWQAEASTPAPSAPAPEPVPVVRLLDEAERAYRSQQWSRAMDAFKAIVARAPDQRHAWLRIGNLHHQRRQFVSAAAAYRRASARAVGDGAEHDAAAAPDPAAAGRAAAASGAMETRNKALVNLALVNLELARAALDDVQDPSSAVSAARSDAARQLDAIEAQARARERGGSATPRLPASPSSSVSPTAPGAVAGPAGPPGVGFERGPVGGARPNVEYLRGAPSP